jgi:hypothetical protein
MPKIIKPAVIDKEWNTAAEARVIVGCGESKWNTVQHEIDHRIIMGRKFWHTAKLRDYVNRTGVDIKAAGTPQRIRPPKAPPPTRRRKAKGESRAST